MIARHARALPVERTRLIGSAVVEERIGRASTQTLIVEFVAFENLGAIAPQWRDLFKSACQPNPFLGPDFLLPLVRRVAKAANAEAALVWGHAAGGRRLLGFLPFRTPWRVPLLSGAVLETFTHPFMTDATPLLDAGEANAVAAALLEALAQRFPHHIVVFHSLQMVGPVFEALAAAAGQQQQTLVAQSFDRAGVKAGLPSDAYLKEKVAGKKLRELRRCEKRLGEAGRVTFETLSGADAPRGLQAFLRIEASGWKGERGTALASHADTRAFAEEALSEADAPSILIDLLSVDGVSIAAAVHLVAGGAAVAFKCAYDETWSRISPGAVLDLYTLRRTLDAGVFECMDSGALPGHPVEALWRDQIRMGQFIVALDASASPAQLEAFARHQERVLGWKVEAKALVQQLRRIRSELRATLAAGRKGDVHPRGV